MIDTRLLGGGPPLGEVEALVIFAGVCRGVQALHEHTPPWAHRCAHGRMTCLKERHYSCRIILWCHLVLPKRGCRQRDWGGGEVKTCDALAWENYRDNRAPRDKATTYDCALATRCELTTQQPEFTHAKHKHKFHRHLSRWPKQKSPTAPCVRVKRSTCRPLRL